MSAPGTSGSRDDPFLPVAAILFPPLAVMLTRHTDCSDVGINILLTALGWIPGVIHAWTLLRETPSARRSHSTYITSSARHSRSSLSNGPRRSVVYDNPRHSTSSIGHGYHHSSHHHHRERRSERHHGHHRDRDYEYRPRHSVDHREDKYYERDRHYVEDDRRRSVSVPRRSGSVGRNVVYVPAGSSGRRRSSVVY